MSSPAQHRAELMRRHFYILKKQRKGKRIHGWNVISFLYDLMEIFEAKRNENWTFSTSSLSVLKFYARSYDVSRCQWLRGSLGSSVIFNLNLWLFDCAIHLLCENGEYWRTRSSRSNVRFLSRLINLHNSFSGQRFFLVMIARLDSIQQSASRVAVKVKYKASTRRKP